MSIYACETFSTSDAVQISFLGFPTYFVATFLIIAFAHSAGAEEYTDSTSAEVLDTLPTNLLDTILNNMMVRFQ